MEIERWRAELKTLEEELMRVEERLEPVIKPLGVLFHELLDKKDLSFILQVHLIYRENFARLVDIVASLAPSLPCLLEEAEVLGRLRQELDEIGNLLSEAVKDKRSLSLEDYVKLLYVFSSVRYAIDYLYARCKITRIIISDILRGGKGDITPILMLTYPVVSAYIDKIVTRSGNEAIYEFFYMGDVFRFSFLVLLVADVYTGSLLDKLKAAQTVEERLKILKECSLLRGLEQVLLPPYDYIATHIRESLGKSTYKRELCLPKMLALRIKAIGDSSRFISYVKELYSGIEKRRYPYYLR